MAFRNMVLNPGTLWGAGQAPLAVQFFGLRGATYMCRVLRSGASLAVMLAGKRTLQNNIDEGTT